MLRHLTAIGVIVALTAVSAVVAGAVPELVGAPKCKVCHKAKTGDQWGIWSGSAHAQAFAVLAGPEARTIAAAQGLDDPQTAEACLRCHTTHGFLGRDTGVDAKAKYADSEGVGCESCHGPGSAYKPRKVMEDPQAARAAGLARPLDESFCIRCHNAESPTFDGFDFAAGWDQIKHPVPGD